MKKKKILHLTSEGIRIKKTELTVMPFIGFYDKAPQDSIYELDFYEDYEKGLKQLIKEERGGPRLSVQLGFCLIKSDGSPVKLNNKPLIFDDVSKKEDLAVDSNGNLVFQLYNEQLSKQYYVLMTPRGEVLDVSQQKIKNVGKNIYAVSVADTPASYYIKVQDENARKAQEVDGQKSSAKVKRIGDFLVTNTRGRHYDYSVGYNYGLKLPTVQSASDTDTINFHNGYAYGDIVTARIGKESQSYLTVLTSKVSIINNYFIDKHGYTYGSFLELLNEDYKRRKNHQPPLIDDIDLLQRDLERELNASEVNVRRHFKDKDIGKQARQSYPKKERDLASKYDNAQLYLQRLLDIVEKIHRLGDVVNP